MLGRFLKDSLVYGASSVLSRLLGLVLLPLFTAHLSPVEFGQVELLTVLGAFISVTITLEISQGMARFFAEFESDAQRDEKSLVSSFLAFTLCCNLVFVVFACLWAGQLSTWLFATPEAADIVYMGALSIALTAMSTAVQTVLRFSGEPVRYALSNFVGIVAGLLASLFFILQLRLGVPGFFLGQALGAVLALLVGLAGVAPLLRWHFSAALLRQMLQFSVPLVPAAVATVSNAYVDRFFIKSMVGLEALGVYGVAGRLAATAGLFAMIFQLTLNPLIYRHHREPGAARELALILRLFFVLAFSLAMGVVMLSPEIIDLIVDAQYQYVEEILPLMFIAILIANSYVFFPGLALGKQTGKIAVITLGAALLNGALNFLLVPAFGVMGSVYSTLCSAAVFILSWYFLSSAYFPVPVKAGRTLLLIALLVMAGAIAPGSLYDLGMGARLAAGLGLCVLCFLMMLGTDSARYLQKGAKPGAAE